MGGVTRDGKMVFPNAVLRTTRAEADYWLTSANKAAALAFLGSFFDSAAAAVAPYIAAGRFNPFSGNEQLEPGIRGRTARGHTAGHAAYIVESGSQAPLVWGDIVHVAPIQMQAPQATVKYDTDARAAQGTRRTVLELAAGQQLIVGAAHICFPGLATCARMAAAMCGFRSTTKVSPGSHECGLATYRPGQRQGRPRYRARSAPQAALRARPLCCAYSLIQYTSASPGKAMPVSSAACQPWRA